MAKRLIGQYIPLNRSKYNNTKVTVDGETFDSKKEASRYMELKIMEKAGLISGLRRQVRIQLTPAMHHPDEPKVIEKASYVADFCYKEDGKEIYEDVKGYKDGAAYRLFRLKKKILLYFYGIHIREV